MGIAGEIAEDIRDSIDTVADTVTDTAREIGEDLREGFQAGTEAMREAVDKAWEEGVRIPLDNAIEKIQDIGEIVLDIQEQAQEILDSIGQKLLEELLEYLSTLSVTVELRAEGYARVEVSTSLFSAEIEFDICKGFTYNFKLLDWTRLNLFYNIDTGIIKFKVEINDKVLGNGWVGLKFGIPATPIPRMFRKQCEKEDEDDKNFKECWMEDGKQVNRGGSGNLRGKSVYVWKRVQYFSRSTQHISSLGTDYFSENYQSSGFRAKTRFGGGQIKTIFNSKGIRWSGGGASWRNDYKVGQECKYVYCQIECYDRWAEYFENNYTEEERDWIDLIRMKYEDAIDYLTRNRNADAETLKEKNKTETFSIEECGTTWTREEIRKAEAVGYYLIFTLKSGSGGNGDEEEPIELCSYSSPAEDIPDVPFMNEECCSLIRQILDRLGGEDFSATIPKSLTDGSNSTEKISTIPDMIAKTIEYQDELAGSYPVEIEIEDTDLTEEGNQGITLDFPNQAEFLAEMYGMMYELLKNLTVTQELAFKAMTISGLNQQALIKTRAQIETIQDYLDFNVNEKENKYQWLFTPGEKDWDKILEETEWNVKTQEYDEEEQTLKSQLIELMQGAAILRARYFRRVGDGFDFMKILKQGASLGADFLESNQEGRQDKQWEDWKDFIEDDLMKKYEEGSVKPDINDIRE